MTRMRALGTAALLAVIAGTANHTATAQGPLNLTPALLTLDDLGSGWRVVDPVGADPDGIAYSVSFEWMQAQSSASLDIALANEPFARPSRAIAPIVDGLRGPSMGPVRLTNVMVTALDAPALGQDASRTWVTATLTDGTTSSPVAFDLLAWRQGPVVALMSMSSNGRTDALLYAQRQERKLADFLSTVQGTAASSRMVTPTPMPAAPFVGLISCASFTHQEAAQAVLTAFPGDPYGLDPDRNGIACDDLPPAGAEVSRVAPVPPESVSARRGSRGRMRRATRRRP
jgi:hypothetical protein